jgi:hypothetical protein
MAARLLASIVESSTTIISKTLTARIQSWNAAAQHTVRAIRRRPGHWTRHIRFIIPRDRHLRGRRHRMPAWKAGRRIDHFETGTRYGPIGRAVQVSLSISPDSRREWCRHRCRRRSHAMSRNASGSRADREKFVTLIENSTDFIGICDLDGVPFLR